MGGISQMAGTPCRVPPAKYMLSWCVWSAATSDPIRTSWGMPLWSGAKRNVKNRSPRPTRSAALRFRRPRETFNQTNICVRDNSQKFAIIIQQSRGGAGRISEKGMAPNPELTIQERRIGIKFPDDKNNS